MKEYFLCLANSKKWNNRCIGGVKFLKLDNKFQLWIHNNLPVWVRPVSNLEHGEVDLNEVSNFKIGDLIEIDVIKNCPVGYQTENINYTPNSMKKIKSIAKQKWLLSKIVDKNKKYLFYNSDKRISEDEINHVYYSLIFIEPKNVEFRIIGGMGHEDQLRARFKYNDYYYDLPITDLDFIDKYKNQFPKNYSNIYFTISLGTNFHRYHYKLIAGIIII